MVVEKKSPVILYIETAGTVCSVALSANDTVLGFRHDNNGRAHAQQLSVFIDDLLSDTGINYTDLQAVAVSKGPGSYTGLRIGVATAKGICFGTDIPLIAVDSLLSLTYVLKQQHHFADSVLYCPMVDARRMEVYTAVFNTRMERVMDTQALIIDESSFADLLKNNKVVFFGDGAEKCKDIICHPNAQFITTLQASATGMIDEAIKAYTANRFEDVAYFEPFYLKDFVVTQSKKKII